MLITSSVQELSGSKWHCMRMVIVLLVPLMSYRLVPRTLLGMSLQNSDSLTFNLYFNLQACIPNNVRSCAVVCASIRSFHTTDSQFSRSSIEGVWNRINIDWAVCNINWFGAVWKGPLDRGGWAAGYSALEGVDGIQNRHRCLIY